MAVSRLLLLMGDNAQLRFPLRHRGHFLRSRRPGLRHGWVGGVDAGACHPVASALCARVCVSVCVCLWALVCILCVCVSACVGVCARLCWHVSVRVCWCASLCVCTIRLCPPLRARERAFEGWFICLAPGTHSSCSSDGSAATTTTVASSPRSLMRWCRRRWVGGGWWWWCFRFPGMYFAILTISTVGYGDVVPVTSEGKIMFIVLAIPGVIFFLYALSFWQAGLC